VILNSVKKKENVNATTVIRQSNFSSVPARIPAKNRIKSANTALARFLQ
jgi:hypothetical protein